MDLNKHKDTKHSGFLFEVQRLAFELERLIDEYGVRDEVITLQVTGLMDTDDEGNSRMKALYSYNITSEEEKDEVIDFINSTYEEPEDEDEYNDYYDEDYNPDVDDMLRNLGIFPN